MLRVGPTEVGENDVEGGTLVHAIDVCQAPLT